MFVLKKLLAPFLLPPGVFSVAMLIIGGVFIKKKNRTGLIFVLLGATLWLLSIKPMADRLMAGLESGFNIPARVNGDVIVLLGGGVIDSVADISGAGTPTGNMLARIVNAVRLHHRLKAPIIVTGGRVYADRPAEANIVKRILVDLGVPKTAVILEDKARDTHENALFAKALILQRRFSHPILVTSAYHMRRSMLSFEQIGLNPQPFPAGILTSPDRIYGWHDYLPTAGSLKATSTALHEYIGLLYYRLAY